MQKSKLSTENSISIKILKFAPSKIKAVEKKLLSDMSMTERSADVT